MVGRWRSRKIKRGRKTAVCLKLQFASPTGHWSSNSTRLSVDWTRHRPIRTFPTVRQEAPGSRGWRMAGATALPLAQYNTWAWLEGSSLHSSKRGCLWVNKHTLCARHMKCILSFHFNPPAQKSEENREQSNCLLKHPSLFCKWFNTLNGFPSAGAGNANWKRGGL